MSWRGNTSRY